MPNEGHPLYAAWLRLFDRMVDAGKAWATARMNGAPDEEVMRYERNQARDAPSRWRRVFEVHTL